MVKPCVERVGRTAFFYLKGDLVLIYQFFVELVWDFVELCDSFVEFAFNFVEKKRIYVEFRTPIPPSLNLLTKISSINKILKLINKSTDNAPCFFNKSSQILQITTPAVLR
ncbi:hypothetical protein COJ85_23545 [Bacillus sp. AFS076308]|nr:hypothetical protein COJ85_23545 [Bacillus sp. AFS076308]PGV51757.1 hypothetical protein COD92_12990 [Bacillus sp. AFS037270]